MDEVIEFENPIELESIIMEPVREETTNKDEDVNTDIDSVTDNHNDGYKNTKSDFSKNTKADTTNMSEVILPMSNDEMMEEEIDQNNKNLPGNDEEVKDSNDDKIQDNDHLDNDEPNTNNDKTQDNNLNKDEVDSNNVNTQHNDDLDNDEANSNDDKTQDNNLNNDEADSNGDKTQDNDDLDNDEVDSNDVTTQDNDDVDNDETDSNDVKTEYNDDVDNDEADSNDDKTQDNDDLDEDDDYGVAKKRKRERATRDVELNCPKCRFKCFSKTGIINHMRKHIDQEANVVKLTCALCSAYFDTNEELVAHKEVHSGEQHSFICAKCKVAFTDHLDWELHRLQHMQRSFYKCGECHKYYKLKRVFKEHLPMHYDRKLPCGICTAVFPSERALRKHAAHHTSAVKLELDVELDEERPAGTRAPKGTAGPRRCGECLRIYSSPKQLRRHMQGHTGVKMIQCLYCGKGCMTEQQRTVHTRVHTNERPYPCKTCSRRFKQPTDLHRHWCNNANKQKTIQCAVCQKTFKTRQGLTAHMLLHSEARPYECAECPRKFAAELSLKHHVIYKHTTDSPYKCEECGKAFKMQAALNRHKRTLLGCDKHRKRAHPELYK